jgi:phosphoribosyl 1,2-cyclic phosphate phosphodiesterase
LNFEPRERLLPVKYHTRMKLEFLGTGTSTGVPQIGCSCEVCTSDDRRDDRMRSSLWIQDEDVSIVVDTGPDFRTQALRSGILHVNAVFFTHFHADHVFGLDDVRIFNYLQNDEIPVFVPDFMVEQFNCCFGYTIKRPTTGLTRPKLKLCTVFDESLKINKLTIQPVDILHGDEKVKGYVFKIGANKIAYLTDCKSLPQRTIETVRGADVVIVSALWKMDKRHPAHLNLDEAVELALRLEGASTYITHMTHNMGLHAATDKILPDNIHLAFDGMVLEFPR